MSIQISRKHSSVRYFLEPNIIICLMLHKFCHNLKEVLNTHTHTNTSYGDVTGYVL